MVKENLIPKTETVYELKTEIPTYEEFMKTYKADERVNASYESEIDAYGELGVEKGHGPCERSDKNCRCYVYHTPPWVQLYIGCVANGCGSNKANASSWVHRYCGGYIYISTELNLKCMKCYRVDDMWNWRFNCYDSQHQGGYEKSSPGVFFNALGFIGNDVDSRHPDVRNKMKIITIKLMEKAGW